MKKVTMQVEGMHCASCASNVEKSLSKIKGITEIKVNVLFGKVYLNSPNSLDKNELINAIKKAGFSVKNLDIV